VTTNMPVGRNNANSRGTHNSTRQINPPTSLEFKDYNIIIIV